MRKIIIALLLTGCGTTTFHDTDAYRRKMRIKRSEQMFETTHEIRKKCAPRGGRPRRPRRKLYYN